MEITLVRSASQRKNPRLVVFNIEGRPGSVQFFRTLFVKDVVPARLTLIGEFAEPKMKETPEERKARLKALPKLTPTERLAKMEERPPPRPGPRCRPSDDTQNAQALPRC